MASVQTEEVRVTRGHWAGKELLARQMRQIFTRCWQFLAHESKISEHVEYVVQKMGP